MSEPSKAGHALASGWAATVRWPADILTAWGVSVAVSIPLALAMRSILSDSIGSSEAGQRLLSGWDGAWFRSFEAQATGLSSSFEPGVVGIGAVFRGLDAMVTVSLGNLGPAVLAAAVVYAGLWVLLSGGLIRRYLSPADPPGLLTAGVGELARLIPLAAIALSAHMAVLLLVFPSLSAFVERATIDVIDERIVIAWLAGKYALLWLLLGLIGLVHDYAKIAMVAETDRGVLGAIVAAAGLVRRRLTTVLAVAAGLLSGFLVVVAVYWVIAPGAEQANAFKILVAFGIGQASIAARIGVRCWGHAARVAVWRDEVGVR